MKTEFLILFLLVCSVTAIALTEPNEAGKTIDKPGVLLAVNSTTLYIYDDDGKPVHVNLEESYSEPEEVTVENLPYLVKFYLHTNVTVSKPQALQPYDDPAFNNSDFKPERSTVFIIPGLMNSYKGPACTTIRDAFLEHGDYNIITVDWISISKRSYSEAKRAIRFVAQHVAKMIDYLETKGMSLSELTLVGHGSGANIAGLAAHDAQHQVSYVVALDPFLLDTTYASSDRRVVSLQDAKYVEVIHTSGGHLGVLSPLGHVDYFPNGGSSQPGCAVEHSEACSHARSYLYYAESINSKVGFVSVRCDTYTQFCQGVCKEPTSLMGGADLSFDVVNMYYLNTNPTSPYARG